MNIEFATARLSTFGKSPRLFLVINAKAHHVERYDMVGSKHPSIHAYRNADLPEGKWYVAKFHTVKPVFGGSAYDRTISVEKDQTSAEIILDPSRFVDLPNEKVLGVSIELIATDDGLAFKLPDPFEAKVREIREIATKQDKVTAGFPEMGAWAETVQIDTECKLIERRRMFLHQMYGGGKAKK